MSEYIYITNVPDDDGYKSTSQHNRNNATYRQNPAQREKGAECLEEFLSCWRSRSLGRTRSTAPIHGATSTGPTPVLPRWRVALSKQGQKVDQDGKVIQKRRLNAAIPEQDTSNGESSGQTPIQSPRPGRAEPSAQQSPVLSSRSGLAAPSTLQTPAQSPRPNRATSSTSKTPQQTPGQTPLPSRNISPPSSNTARQNRTSPLAHHTPHSTLDEDPQYGRDLPPIQSNSRHTTPLFPRQMRTSPSASNNSRGSAGLNRQSDRTRPPRRINSDRSNDPNRRRSRPYTPATNDSHHSPGLISQPGRNTKNAHQSPQSDSDISPAEPAGQRHDPAPIPPPMRSTPPADRHLHESQASPR